LGLKEVIGMRMGGIRDVGCSDGTVDLEAEEESEMPKVSKEQNCCNRI